MILKRKKRKDQLFEDILKLAQSLMQSMGSSMVTDEENEKTILIHYKFKSYLDFLEWINYFHIPFDELTSIEVSLNSEIGGNDEKKKK